MIAGLRELFSAANSLLEERFLRFLEGLFEFCFKFVEYFRIYSFEFERECAMVLLNHGAGAGEPSNPLG